MKKEQVIKICNSVIRKLNEAKENHKPLFLCPAIKSEIQNIEYRERYEIDIEKEIPEFTLVNAKIMANAEIDVIDGSTWWGQFDYANRIKFMEWIKECYTSKK